MREILFRGKRIDNGEWVYGYYVFRRKRRGIFGQTITELDFDTHYIVSVRGESFEVDPSTVGEFTGLTANGKRIFEGDILAVEQISDSIEHFESPVKCPYNVVVKWDKCSWMWETIGTARKRYLHFPEAWLFRKCEVIGNAIDTPDLLEVKE